MLPSPPPERWPLLVAVAVAASLAGALSVAMPAPDLLAEYVAAQRVLMGETHLFDRAASQAVWARYAPGDAYPYVHPPGVAVLAVPWALLPWPAAKALAIAAIAAAWTGSAAIAARTWLPPAQVLPTVALSLAVALTWAPVSEALALGNLHALALFGMVASFFLSTTRPRVAGVLLGVAIALKISPALLLGVWLLQGRARAIAACAITLAAIAAIGGPLGLPAQIAWIDVLADNGSRAITSHFAQGIAGAWARLHAPDAGILDPLPTPWWIKAFALGVLAIWLADLARTRRSPEAEGHLLVATLLATLIAPPLVWSHYHIVLIIPAIYLASRRDLPGWIGLGVLLLAQLPWIARTDWHTAALVPMWIAAGWPRPVRSARGPVEG